MAAILDRDVAQSFAHVVLDELFRLAVVNARRVEEVLGHIAFSDARRRTWTGSTTIRAL